MRKAGKTTRAIDRAVQVLFEFGEVYIPRGSEINLEGDNAFNGVDIRTVILDTDYNAPRAQEELHRKVLLRLQNEHKAALIVRGQRISLEKR